MDEDRASQDAPPDGPTGRMPPPPRMPGGLPMLLLAEFAAMIRFYSRLPIPLLGPADEPASPPPFGRAIRMLPWASLIVAAPAACLAALLARTNLPGLVVGALVVAMLAAVSGAFHEDGFADVADGFGGGATPERRLAIMKDSRIGAFGGVALAAQFLLRAALVGEAVDRFEGDGAGLAVLAAAVLARVLPPALMSALPPARPDGLGRAAGRPEPQALLWSIAGGAAIWFAATAGLDGSALPAIGFGFAIAAVFGLGLWARAKIGGFTGDVIGAGTIAVEIAALGGLLV